MSIFELAEKRESVRKYSDRKIPRESLFRCVQAAGIAPSANNCQPWHFVIVDDPDKVKGVAEATFSTVVSFNKFTLHAAAIVVVLVEKSNFITQVGETIKNLHYELMDVGMAVENFCLQGVKEGFGTCILGWFRDRPIKKILSIPKNKKIALVIAAGYSPEDGTRQKKRKDISEISSYNQYGQDGEYK